MKYAFIALIACYLLVYGCGPDNSKKTEEKKGQAVHSTEVKPLPPAPAAATPETVKQQAASATEAAQPLQQTAVAPPSQTPSETPKAPAAEEGKTDITAQGQQPPCAMMTDQPGAVELTQPDEENIVVMPCGCMFLKRQIPANAPCLKGQIPPCPMMGGKQPTMEELVMMPCGRVFVRQMEPTEDGGAAQLQKSETAEQIEAQTQIVEGSDQDLATAVQKMVEATNDMVLVTQHLVVATQEMLKATQGKALEPAAAKQDIQQMPEAATGTKKQPPITEQEVVNAMRDAVLATQKAIEAINQTVPNNLAPKQ